MDVARYGIQLGEVEPFTSVQCTPLQNLQHIFVLTIIASYYGGNQMLYEWEVSPNHLVAFLKLVSVPEPKKSSTTLKINSELPKSIYVKVRLMPLINFSLGNYCCALKISHFFFLYIYIFPSFLHSLNLVCSVGDAFETLYGKNNSQFVETVFWRALFALRARRMKEAKDLSKGMNLPLTLILFL